MHKADHRSGQYGPVRYSGPKSVRPQIKKSLYLFPWSINNNHYQKTNPTCNENSVYWCTGYLTSTLFRLESYNWTWSHTDMQLCWLIIQNLHQTQRNTYSPRNEYQFSANAIWARAWLISLLGTLKWSVLRLAVIAFVVQSIPATIGTCCKREHSTQLPL